MRKLLSNFIKLFFTNVDVQDELSTAEISIFFLLVASVVMIATVYI